MFKSFPEEKELAQQAFSFILPAVDPDCDCCRQNRPKNCFAVNGKRDTSKKKFIWMTLRYYYEKMLELNSVKKLLIKLKKLVRDSLRKT